MKNYKKYVVSLFAVMSMMFIFNVKASAAPDIYTVVSGDSMWKIAVKYQVGVSEIIAANPQVKNPALIYPGQKLTIPTLSDVKAIENKVAQLVNQERAKRGLPPLSYNWELARVARYKSADMANKNYFSHTSPTYGSPFRMMETFGIRSSAAGENIAMGQQTPEAVMIAWMNSPGHKANILSNNFTQIGVGYAKSSTGRIYWTQMFIRP